MDSMRQADALASAAQEIGDLNARIKKLEDAVAEMAKDHNDWASSPGDHPSEDLLASMSNLYHMVPGAVNALLFGES